MMVMRVEACSTSWSTFFVKASPFTKLAEKVSHRVTHSAGKIVNLQSSYSPGDF
jgi:hypothetical protein